MSNLSSIETLPRLIARAMATLDKATTAAEFLESIKQATVAYDAAKLAERFTDVKSAHDTVIAACHKAMADALVIEAQAQCRLADEYDAAQARGEVQKVGGDRTSNIPKQNNVPKVADVGLTSKQVHEARAVRDAEKKKPGIVRSTVDKKMEAKESPTKADVKRAIKQVSPNKNSVVERETARREAVAKVEPEIDRSALLSMTAQQKLDAAIRQHKRKLDLEFDIRMRAELRRRRSCAARRADQHADAHPARKRCVRPCGRSRHVADADL
jgi:hypothetical protein